MVLPVEVKTAPVQRNERNLAYEVFLSQIEPVKTGKVKRFERLTLKRDYMSEEWEIIPPNHNQQEGIVSFSVIEIRDAAARLFNELTAEANGWTVVDEISQDDPDKREQKGTNYDLLTWRIGTIVDGVGIEVVKLVDDRGEWVRTYYLAHQEA